VTKTLQTNIAMNDLYDTVLDLQSLMSYRSFIAVLVWSVFVY